MKKASKIFSLVLLCALMLLMTACGGKDSATYTRGKWSGSTYTSTFLGFKTTPGSEWSITSDENLAKMAGITDFSDSNVKKTLDSGMYIPEVALFKPNGASITIAVQDNNKASVKITEADYTQSGADVVQAQMSQLGVTCTVTPGTVSFLGKSTKCLEVAAYMQGEEAHEIQVPIFVGSYVASVTFAARTKAELYDEISMIKAI